MKHVTTRAGFGKSSLGTVCVVLSERGICGIMLGEDREALLADARTRFPGVESIESDEAVKNAVAQVVAVVEDPYRELTLPLDIQGTAFQQQIWSLLRAIPAGSTTSYSRLAHEIGRPTAVRAVAQACASNRLAIVIPCHRVLRSSGAISGYRWGVERKRALLDRERPTAPPAAA